MKENSMGYSDEWQLYKGDYDKFEYDIKLSDDKIIENCYPNGGDFTPLESNDHYNGKSVKEIRFSNNPKSYLNISVSKICEEHYKKQDKMKKDIQKIKIIIGEQTPLLPEMKNPKTFGKENEQLIADLIKFAKTTSGIGLAANQCAINDERIMDRFFLHLNRKTQEWFVIIDPKITKYIGITDNRIEGCLTWPNQKIGVKRYRRIEVSYYDINGNFKEKPIERFDAHVWQHEIDHLNGVVEDFWSRGINRIYNGFALSNPKYQRNDLCPCGSGLKYKKCCGLYEIAENNY